MSTSEIPPLAVDQQRTLRFGIYWILILVSAATMVGRIWMVKSHEDTPFLSANDTSRWCTIRALAHNGVYEIDEIIDDKETGDLWGTIDKVRHRGRDGKQHYYSSKVPLWPTILAGEYWVIKTVTGATLETHPFYVARMMLIINHVLPMILYLFLLACLIERFGTTDWGRIFVMACAAFGTFLPTFAVTLNNHLPAAVCVLIALHAALKIWADRDRGIHWFLLAGLFGAFAVVNELPALSFFAAITVACALRSPLRTLVAFVPAAAVVAAGFLYTNYLAHDDLRPAYAHRQDGELVATVGSEEASQLNQGAVSTDFRKLVDEALDDDAQLSLELTVNEAEVKRDTLTPAWKVWEQDNRKIERRWVLTDELNERKFAILEFDEGDSLEVRAWDNWYEYEGSYWLNPKGVDQGEESQVMYAVHMLVGHHGVFSLTPIWLLSLVGLVLALKSKAYHLRCFSLMVIALTVVCVAFYIARPLQDRNYGGVCCGMRWLFWFTPLWLIAMLPAADAISTSRIWKIVAVVLLVVSVISASYAISNPWTHPWIYEYWQALQWAPQA